MKSATRKRIALMFRRRTKIKNSSARASASLCSIDKLPPFGYPNFLRHAKTVDVIWLNRRAMPHSLFEVELTTDMRISLLKFSELQDFYTTMRIVAPSSRLREFEDKISADAFYAIRRRVKFSDLDEIARQYESAQRQAILT